MPVTRFADYITKASAAEIMERSQKASQEKPTPNNIEPPRNIFANVLSRIDTDTLKVMESEGKDIQISNDFQESLTWSKPHFCSRLIWIVIAPYD